MNWPLVALCIGHSRFINGRRDGGAVSVGGVSEWDYNGDLAQLIAGRLAQFRIRSVIVSEYEGNGYGAAMRWLASHLRGLDVDGAVELHFNSAHTTATGHEWLYWQTSRRGEALARSLDDGMRQQVPPHILRARGIKPVSIGRGSEFLRLTHCPACVAEPFFGSNPADWKIATEQKPKIAQAIANGIFDWLE